MTTDGRIGAMRPAGRPFRAVRSVAAALMCVLAASVGHVTAGGPLPAGSVAAVFGGATVVVWILSNRRLTAGQLTGLLVLCQVCVHLSATDEMSMGAAMLAGHVAATLVSAAVLARGEHLVWQVAERLALRVAPLLGRPVLVPSAVQPAPAAVLAVPHTTRLAHSLWSRGPPSGLV